MDFRLLGPLEVAERDHPRALGGVKQRSLLALLLLQANELASTDRLIEQLWGAAPPATAAKSIQVVLHVAPPELDLARFEQLVGEAARSSFQSAARKLRKALLLWRGPALADLAYESFAQVEVARPEEPVRAAALT